MTITPKGQAPHIQTFAWQEVRDGAFAEKNALQLIDLRSEKEFARGAIPAAVNLPLLDNQERHGVGLTYKNEGKGPATRLGLELFAAKANAFLEACLNLSAGGSKPLLLYCWRGGMRSRLVALWLQSLQLRVGLLGGGYKAYRQGVLAELADLARHPLLVLNGHTGSGKTQLLVELAAEGLPALDLEGLAHHRGSAFGGFQQSQPAPSQQGFENHLAERWAELKSHPRLLVELEGALGPVLLPPSLRQAITRAPMVYVERDFAERVELLACTYASSWGEAESQSFLAQLELVRRFLPTTIYHEIQEAISRVDLKAAIALLLIWRYDKAYAKSLKRHHHQAIATFNLSCAEAEGKGFLRRYLM